MVHQNKTLRLSRNSLPKNESFVFIYSLSNVLNEQSNTSTPEMTGTTHHEKSHKKRIRTHSNLKFCPNWTQQSH